MKFLNQFVIMSSEEFDDLQEYSMSLPTSLYDGKLWKLQRRNKWYLSVCHVSDNISQIEIFEIFIKM